MKNYCPDLFKNLFVQKIDETSVELGHCCISKRSAPTDKILFTNKFLEEGRSYFLSTGELPNSCSQCKDLESIGSTSKRLQNTHTNFSIDKELLWLQYNCDNICNLKCIMCGSYSSSAWIEDEIKLGLPVVQKVKHTKHNKILFDFQLNKLQLIYFNGGEPLMTKDHLQVLEYIQTCMDTKNTNVIYNTNATFPVNDSMLKVWEKFNNINLIASIDAIGDQFEYIRFPAKWTEILSNLSNYKSNGLTVSVGANIGVHNVLYFGELYNWALENNLQFNFQSDTVGELSLRNFPTQLIPYAIDYLNNQVDSDTKQILLQTLKNAQTPNHQWITTLNKLDKIRGNSWKVSLKNLYDLDQQFFNNYDA